jgi:hypothetical protein
MKTIILLSVILISLQGCTSIDQPTASRALVEGQFLVPAQAIDSSLSEALSNSKAGAALSVDGQVVVMGEQFFAAIGLNCRKVNSEQADKFIYCLNSQDVWFKVNKVIAEYNELDMLEVSL